MQLPLSFSDFSLVLAVAAIVLLITSELAYIERRNLAIEKKALKRAAIIFGFAFLFTVVIRVYQIISAA